MKAPFPWRIRSGWFLTAWLAGFSAVGADPSIGGQKEESFETTVQKHVSMRYLLFTPTGYEAAGQKRWPLMIFLHGAGERGTDLALVTRHGPPKIVQNRPDFPFVLVSPQCPEGATWDVEGLELLLKDILRREAVDTHRVVLTGLSMGGFGTWAWAAAHPEHFAAIVPICGGGDPLPVWLSEGERRAALASLPIWSFHGGKDPVVPLSESQRMVDAYQRIGNHPKLTVYPEAGHDSWTQAYAEPELFEWLLKQKRP